MERSIKNKRWASTSIAIGDGWCSDQRAPVLPKRNPIKTPHQGNTVRVENGSTERERKKNTEKSSIETHQTDPLSF